MLSIKNKRIAIFFKRFRDDLVLYQEAAKSLNIELDTLLYDTVVFSTTNNCKIQVNNHPLNYYDLIFFRTIGNHYEEADLIINEAKLLNIKFPDPILEKGKPSFIRKAYQMINLPQHGLQIPATTYASISYIRNLISKNCLYPSIIKGSGGNRGTMVFKVNNETELDDNCKDLEAMEETGERFMLQEYIENNGDYRILVLGDKALGVIKRSSPDKKTEFKNNVSRGGLFEEVELPQNLIDLAIKAAKVQGLSFAGVDMVFRDNDFNKPVFWEVNRSPQYQGFMKATGINVPEKLIEFLARY